MCGWQRSHYFCFNTDMLNYSLLSAPERLIYVGKAFGTVGQHNKPISFLKSKGVPAEFSSQWGKCHAAEVPTHLPPSHSVPEEENLGDSRESYRNGGECRRSCQRPLRISFVSTALDRGRPGRGPCFWRMGRALVSDISFGSAPQSPFLQ